jgi:cytochrome c biogenesis protein CcmG/thiol:disulfide interchange protein DsbE
MIKKAFIGALLLAACSGSTADVSDMADIPETSADEFQAHMTGIDRPAVVNVWASWCLPCRSEAPLLDQAYDQYNDRIEFIGVSVQDNQPDAKAFLAEFGLAGFDHFFDRDREVPNLYGAIGTPVTMFFGPRGELIKTHNGVVDERTLALNIDELLRLES